MVSKPRIKTLKLRSDFATLSKRGRKISPAPWLTLNYKDSDASILECGWTIPKQVGTAVVRNRLKRWSRELTRSFWDAGELRPCRINFFFRPQAKGFFKELRFEEFKEVFETGLRRIGK